MQWEPPRYGALYQILTNPLYAGVYCFGKRHSRVDPVSHERHTVNLARQEWDVFLPDHHAGYIDLRQHEGIMARLEANRPSLLGPGAAREEASELRIRP